MTRKRKQNQVFFWLFLIALGSLAWLVYQHFILNKASLKEKGYAYLYLGKQQDFDDLMQQIRSEQMVEDPEAFEWLAQRMKLPENIHPGKYRINTGMTARQIINQIKYKKEEKVKLSYNSQIRTLQEFVEYTAMKLELEEEEITDWMEDEEKLERQFSLNPENAFALVVPGTYELSWAISVEDLFTVLKERFDKLWSTERRRKARALGYSIPEIVTLASIVQSESGIRSEQMKIAGVYLNRLAINMPLQADPTLKFATENFEARRLLNADKEINSPYNTYKNKGLPPGPIALVSSQAIDATLNYAKHNFLYFCAKPGLDGYSDFSRTYEQHRRFALAYQKALDEKGINR